MSQQKSKRQRTVDLRKGLPDWFSGEGIPNRIAFAVVEKVLGYSVLDKFFSLATEGHSGGDYFARLVEVYRLDVRISGPGKDRIPESGPLIVVANHPFGGADAIAVGDLAIRHRTDTKILGNEFLGSVKPLHPWILGVDVFGGGGAAMSNLRGLRAATRHLADGGCLVVFPAGEVAAWQRQARGVVEAKWASHVASLAKRNGARIVPIFLPGRNSIFFHLLGQIHPILRTAWLGRELLRRRGRSVKMIVGDPLQIAAAETPESAIEKLRAATFLLASD